MGRTYQKYLAILFKGVTICSCGLIGALTLSGCNLNSGNGAFDPPLKSEFSVDSKDVILVSPDYQEREQYQLLISHLTQMLSNKKASHEQRAQILYQLGLLYDRLGLDVTARTMFMGALVEVPDYADAYNFLGIYLASKERFSEAYDAYDAVIEIDPEESYAYFNRGIALYYGNLARLAVSDLKKFYDSDKNDPFRIAWLYLAERADSGEEYAHKMLQERRDAVKKDVPWGTEVLDYMLGKISGHELIDGIRKANLDDAESARRLCEAYFYMGKMAAFDGNVKRAYDLYHLCVATNVTGYLEYRYAQLEISRYERQELMAKADEIATKQQEERDRILKEQAEEARKFFENLKEKSNILKPGSKVREGTAPQAGIIEVKRFDNLANLQNIDEFGVVDKLQELYASNNYSYDKAYEAERKFQKEMQKDAKKHQSELQKADAKHRKELQKADEKYAKERAKAQKERLKGDEAKYQEKMHKADENHRKSVRKAHEKFDEDRAKSVEKYQKEVQKNIEQRDKALND